MLNIFRITFYLILILFFADIFDVFQTKIEFLKVLIYYGVLLMPIPLLIMEFKKNQSRTELKIGKAIPILAIAILVYLNPLKIMFHIQTWKTQTVLLINEKMINHKVEYQMKDIGALGYAKRTAELVYFSQYFYMVYAKNYEVKNSLGVQWLKVNQVVNEIGFK